MKPNTKQITFLLSLIALLNFVAYPFNLERGEFHPLDIFVVSIDVGVLLLILVVAIVEVFRFFGDK